jgi:subtilisin family serine protease
VIGSDLYLLRLPAGVTADAAMSEMATDPDTRWVELNYVNQAPEGRPGYFFVSGESTDAPGETYAPALLGNDPELQRCATGQGVTVAVLDTGIDATHPALVGRVLETGWNALDNTADVSDVGNDVDDDGDGLVDEMVGHGTHVAGIVVQVAPDVSILPVKVLGSDGVGDAFYVAAGIYYAVSQGVDVINLSLSSTYDARVVAEAVAEANEAGVVVVAAAGNGATNRVLEFPAADTGVLGIAATDQNDLKSEFSNFGDRIDLSAPGVEIVSAVAGAAALLAEENPDWVAPEISRRLTETAAALDELNPDFAGELGSGRLDVRAALACDDAGNL